jgi:aminoglycoside phosphotransferase (APT) family kinase protein
LTGPDPWLPMQPALRPAGRVPDRRQAGDPATQHPDQRADGNLQFALASPDASTLVAQFGQISDVRQLGPRGTTWLLQAADRRIVMKKMPGEADRNAWVRRFERLSCLSPRRSPMLLGTNVPVSGLPGDGSWWACFEYVEEATGMPEAAQEGRGPIGLDAMVQLGATLRAVDPAIGHPLEAVWLDRLADWLGASPAPPDAARRLLGVLADRMPAGRRFLAHGDLCPRNVIMTVRGPVLIDWEELGDAPDGFDTGWLLALARMGAGVGWTRAAVWHAFVASAMPDASLRWFEALGVLRMAFRTETLPMAAETRARVRWVITRHLEQLAGELAAIPLTSSDWRKEL